jgi:hypothetical protein
VTGSPPLPQCHKCGRTREAGKVEFRAVCDCGAWLHVCLNCRHYDRSAYHECRCSATAEYVSDKEKTNLCEEFDSLRGPSGGPAGKSRADIEKLFPGLS